MPAGPLSVAAIWRRQNILPKWVDKCVNGVNERRYGTRPFKLKLNEIATRCTKKSQFFYEGKQIQKLTLSWMQELENVRETQFVRKVLENLWITFW